MASEEVLVGGFIFLFQGIKSLFKKMVNKVLKDVQLCALVMSVKSSVIVEFWLFLCEYECTLHSILAILSVSYLPFSACNKNY